MHKQAANIIIRLPHSKQYFLLKGWVEPKLTPLNLKFSGTTFVISPFNCGNKAYHIRINNVQRIHPEKEINFTFFYKTLINTGNKNYHESVSESIDKLVENSVQKVVISTQKIFKHQNNITQSFIHLCNQHPANFCYLLSCSLTGTIVCATPEILLKSNNGYTQTMALAGTKTNHNDQWTQKEIEEQFLVQQHIKTKLTKLSAFYKVGKTKPVASGKLLHLKTNFTTYTSSKNFVRLVKQLNPTPAVAGLPVKESIKIIGKVEPSDRNFYCGFSGLLNFNKQHQLYVNLRFAEISDKEIKVFGGAGITTKSNPASEEKEVEAKINAIAGFFID